MKTANSTKCHFLLKHQLVGVCTKLRGYVGQAVLCDSPTNTWYNHQDNYIKNTTKSLEYTDLWIFVKSLTRSVTSTHFYPFTATHLENTHTHTHLKNAHRLHSSLKANQSSLATFVCLSAQTTHWVGNLFSLTSSLQTRWAALMESGSEGHWRLQPSNVSLHQVFPSHQLLIRAIT